MSSLRDPDIMLRCGPYAIERRVLPPDDDLAPGADVVGTFLGRALIGRYAGEPDPVVTAEPRQLAYVGLTIGVAEGLQAQLFALIPAEREPREPEPEVLEFTLSFLGNLVRIPPELKGLPREQEFIDHFNEVVSGRASSVIDRLLPHL